MGVKCSLKEKATPRAYYQNQAGMGVADYVIALPDAQYDIGLYKDAKTGGYTASTDFFGGTVERVLGAKAGTGDNAMQAKLGKLYQSYAIAAATRKATMQGHSVRRINGKDGAVKLVITGSSL